MIPDGGSIIHIPHYHPALQSHIVVIHICYYISFNNLNYFFFFFQLTYYTIMSAISLLFSSVIILSLVAVNLAQNNFFFTDGFLQPPPQSNFFPPPQSNQVSPHRAVVQAAQDESRLPPNLLNPFYKNPRLRQELARHSWFGPGEQPVYDREAEKIPRKEIYTVLNHAGLLRTNNL